MANKFTEKRIEAEILSDLYDRVEQMEKDRKRAYQVIGKEEEQAKDWRTGELKWEDEEHTIPTYDNKWGYVDKEELSDEDVAYLTVCKRIKAALEKLV